jgi:hypothetical protein
MRASIEPVSAVSSKLLTDLLRRYGLPSEIIEWKYFDPAWTPRGERGYVWTRDGRAQGMIGLIPFRMSGPGGGISAAWTCDWYVEASEKNPGIGVLVFKEAIARTGALFTLGGNEATARLVPRLAAQTAPEAAVELTVPLTLGGTVTYSRVARRLRPVARLGLDRVPLRRVRAAASGRGVSFSAGIAREVAGLIEEGSGSGWAPAYDAAQLAWQFERCPAIDAVSAFVPGERGATAALIGWHPRGGSRQWRVALWPRPGHEDAAQALLRETLAELVRRRGQSVSTLVAHRDTWLRGSFEALGFRPTEKVLPLYALGDVQVPPITDVGRISHTDSDLGYRFG